MFVYEVITLVFCSLILTDSIVFLFRRGINVIAIVFIFFYLIFILPVGLDLLFGIPDYSRFHGFEASFNDELVNLTYLTFLMFTSLLFKLTRGNKVFNFEFEPNNKFIVISLLIALSPVFFVLFAPSIELYALYGGAPLRGYNIEQGDFHSYLASLTMLSSICIAYLLVYSYKKNWFLFFLVLLVLPIDIWLHGKRIIFILFVTSLIFIVFITTRKLNFKTASLALSMFISVFLFSSWYQNTVRDFSDESFDSKYLNMRVDYSRDQRVKMALYSSLYPDDMQILEYPGQSFVFTSTFLIPRSVWSDKPWPYPHYFTSAMLYLPPDRTAWTMTTSWFDEFISNFGLFGILIGPLSFIYFIKLGTNKNNPYLSLLTLMLACIYLLIHTLSFIFLLVIWLYLLFKSKFKFKIKLR